MLRYLFKGSVWRYWGWSKDLGRTIRCGCPTPFFLLWRQHERNKSFFIDCRDTEAITDATAKLYKQIGTWVKNNYETLLTYDTVKIYYDNGRVELSRILASVFNVLLPSVETKKVIPSDYRLFQVADFIWTMKLTKLKLEKHNMSVQELRFFGGEGCVKKNYLKDLKKYELN